MEIKRGEKRKKKRTDFKWQNITNEDYGQLILSFNYQQPGTARNYKGKIFSDDYIYNKIFYNEQDNKLIIDLLKLSSYFDEFKNKHNSDDSNEDSIVTNGKFIILSLIGFFIKYFRGSINLSIISDSDSWLDEISKNDLSGSLFCEPMSDDFDKYIQSLFTFLVYEIKDIYERRFKNNDETSVTNFFKRDKRYRDILIKHFIDRVIKNQIELDRLKNYFQIFAFSK